MLGRSFDRFVEASPISVMVRGLMERVFASEQVNCIFEDNTKIQYTRELLFSSQIELMSLVVCGLNPWTNATYQVKAKQLNVRRSGVYDQLNSVETKVSAAIVRETAKAMASIIEMFERKDRELLPGYQVRVLDGNCLAITNHRLSVLKTIGTKALPEKLLVVFDPQLGLVINVFPTDDSHAQEHSLLEQVLTTVQPNELWISDRNLCTQEFLFDLHRRGANFIIREDKSKLTEVNALQLVSRIKTGDLFEQTVRLTIKEESLLLRRIVLNLKQPMCYGEKEIALLTMLSPDLANAPIIAKLYQERCSIENFLQTMTDNYEYEIQTLGYPTAAFLSFCLVLITYNTLATLRTVISCVHGGKGDWPKNLTSAIRPFYQISAGLLDSYIVDEIQGTYRGMMIAIAPEKWKLFASFSLFQLTLLLQDLAAQVPLSFFCRQNRTFRETNASKSDFCYPHASTAKLFEDLKN